MQFYHMESNNRTKAIPTSLETWPSKPENQGKELINSGIQVEKQRNKISPRRTETELLKRPSRQPLWDQSVSTEEEEEFHSIS